MSLRTLVLLQGEAIPYSNEEIATLPYRRLRTKGCASFAMTIYIKTINGLQHLEKDINYHS